MKLLDRKLVFKGHRVEVYEDEIKADDGRVFHYDYVHNRNGAGILLVDDSEDEEKLIFVKQYRNTVGKDDIEIPAGCQNFPEEDFLVCALREAEEETGYIPAKVYYLTKIIAAVGIFDEMTAIYIGTGLEEGCIKRDEDEFIDIVKMTLDEAVEAVYEGRIIDSKTIIAILAYKDLKNSERFEKGMMLRKC
jgi:ADP-ribose pyrophosphatase